MMATFVHGKKGKDVKTIYETISQHDVKCCRRVQTSLRKNGLKPNTAYKLSGWTYVDDGESIRFGARSFGGSEVSTASMRYKVYKRNILTFTTGAASTSATVFILKTSSGKWNAYADDFALQ